MSQWTEIRHAFFVEHAPKREIARRFGVDRKTVDRAVAATEAPTRRVSPPRGRRLDAFREEIEGWLKADHDLKAKRVGTLLREAHPELKIRERAIRRFVARLRGRLYPPEAFVHRTHVPGRTVEGDFGETWLEIGGEAVKARYFVATLPASNVYFARVYPVERLECLFDGLLAAFRKFGGLPDRLVLDNTSLAVREVLMGTERIENRTFQAFRGELALAAEFCAPAKGWEKGSVERGVEYVRQNCFRPRLVAASFEDANAKISAILDADLDTRRLPDGRTCRAALAEERTRLRPLPAHLPDACRVTPRVIDKFGHVLVDGVRYSVPTELAYKPAMLRLFHDRVEIQVDQATVATHSRSFRAGHNVLDPRHVLDLLSRKHRAAGEATALMGLPPILHELRSALRDQTRRPDREWIEVLKLLIHHPEEELAAATKIAIDRKSPRLATIKMLLRQEPAASIAATPVSLDREDLASVTVAKPDLAAYDAIAERVA